MATALGSSSIPGILAHGASENRGENARLESYVGAIAIGDLVKTTLGPRGMDKILERMDKQGPRGKNITVTNDGATILQSIWVDNPAAKILVDMSRTQDQQCGDGTTSVVVLAAEMLRRAEDLVTIQKLHPMVIIKGFRAALATARKTLEGCAFDNGKDETKFREDLLAIARTTLSSKLLHYEKDKFAELAVDAVLRLKGRKTLDYIQVIKKPGGSLRDSYLEDGFILEKRIGTGMPKKIEDCKVMIANTPMDTDKIKIYGARVKVDSLTSVQEIEAAEKEKMKDKVNRICDSGCNVFINRQLIYNYPEQCFRDRGVVAIEHSDFEGTERLAAVLDADIASTFEEPKKIKLGRCKEIKEIMLGEDKAIQFTGCASGEACCIVLRGASQHVLDEAERSLHDALAVLYQTIDETRVVYGGGCTEMEMAVHVLELAAKTEGKEALAIEAFAKALMAMPGILSENGGFDAAELVGNLRAMHQKGEKDAGLDLSKGEVASMSELRICESYRSKLSQLCAATEAAEQVVRVDNIIRNAPRQRNA
ncbi:T-complex protein 1 subunit beta [Perkinsus chesapeaki]|uniref:CCT-beta n=1 Tax=Perkinsus chesapeaki TaxID=330153 RepID=A0A7J6L1H0_PERCH|nr:T-complex protein 1 subunit beta [Perkinsus chesapeaki]